MLHGLFYVEFLAQSLEESKSYFEGYGLRSFAKLEHGNGVWLKNRSGVSVIVREAATDVERAKLTRSGSCVTDVSYLVSDVDELLRNVRLASKTVLDMNVTSSVGKNGDVRFVQLFFPRPGLRHTLFESSDFGLLLDGWRLTDGGDGGGIADGMAGNSNMDEPDLVAFIDHIAIACLGGTMKAIVEWYELALCLKQKLGVITIKTELGDGLRLASLYHRDDSKNESFCQLTFVESVSIVDGDGQNQVTTFLKNHGGPGVQHLAFLTHDIFSARAVLAKRGVEFLAAPPGYYELPHMQGQADAAGLELSKLEEGGILFDNEPERMNLQDGSGGAGNQYLLQVFTRSPFKRNTCFFELICRGNHREGFGAGNIRNLFLAVALERKSRARNASSSQASSNEEEASEEQIVAGRESLAASLSSPRSPNPPREADVVVIATTIAGLATALALARNKVSVVLIGKEGAAADGDFVTMPALTMHLWRQLGVLESVLEASLELRRKIVHLAEDSTSAATEVWVIDVHALRTILLRELRNLSQWCELRLGHDVVAIGSMKEAVSVHTEVRKICFFLVSYSMRKSCDYSLYFYTIYLSCLYLLLIVYFLFQPPGPLLSKYVVDAGGIDSFWAAYLKSSAHGGPEQLLSVHLSNPLGKPALEALTLWLSPVNGVTESLCAFPLKDGSLQLVFPLPAEELGAVDGLTELHFIGEFCALLGLDAALGLEKETTALELLRAEMERLRQLEADEEKKAVYEERIAFGLDCASEQIQIRQERLKQSRWWTPIVALPSAALRFAAGNIGREENKSAERAKVHRALQTDYQLMMAEVQKKEVIVQNTMNQVRKQLIRSSKRVQIGPPKRLKKAVDGRCIFLVNNTGESSMLNADLNEGLADVSSLVWRLVMVLQSGGGDRSEGKPNELDMFAKERLYAQEIQEIRKENFLRFCMPGTLSDLRDAVGLCPFWLRATINPVALSSSSLIRGDWNSSLKPTARDFFEDGPVVMKDGTRKKLSELLPSYGFTLLVFGAAPPAVPAGVCRIVILDVGQKAPASVFLAAASQTKLEVVNAIELDSIWKKYHASEGSVLLLRPDMRVEARNAKWCEEFESGLKRAVAGKFGVDTNSFYWSDMDIGLRGEKRQAVPAWDALPFQWAIFWILYGALMQFQPAQRNGLLLKILQGLGRSTDGSKVDLAKQVVSLCISQGIQAFELNDIVERCVEKHLVATSQMKHSRSSQSINSADSSRSAEDTI